MRGYLVGGGGVQEREGEIDWERGRERGTPKPANRPGRPGLHPIRPPQSSHHLATCPACRHRPHGLDRLPAWTHRPRKTSPRLDTRPPEGHHPEAHRLDSTSQAQPGPDTTAWTPDTGQQHARTPHDSTKRAGIEAKTREKRAGQQGTQILC